MKRLVSVAIFHLTLTAPYSEFLTSSSNNNIYNRKPDIVLFLFAKRAHSVSNTSSFFSASFSSFFSSSSSCVRLLLLLILLLLCWVIHDSCVCGFVIVYMQRLLLTIMLITKINYVRTLTSSVCRCLVGVDHRQLGKTHLQACSLACKMKMKMKIR